MKAKKIAKRTASLLLMAAMMLSTGLYACAPDNPGTSDSGSSVSDSTGDSSSDSGSDSTGGSSSSSEDVKVSGISITNSGTTLPVGETEITAACQPAGSEQGYTVTLESEVMGVTLEGKTIKVHPGAVSGETVRITVASTEDPSVRDTREFTLTIGEVDWVDISTADELLAIGSSEESMSKNYRLTTDITIERIDGDGNRKPFDWVPFDLPFTGLFDGQGYSIKGISVPKGTDITGGGFFKENRGVIRNVSFDNSEYPGYRMYMGADSGVVAGVNKGGILNVSTNVALLTTEGTAGAIAGTNEGWIEYCYAKGATATDDAEAEKAGVVGSNSGVITATVADESTTGLNYFIGSGEGHDADEYNDMLLDSVAMQTEKTYADLGWSDDVWYYADSVYPILVNEYFDPLDIIADIEITSPQTIEVGDYPEGTKLQLTLNKTNCILDDVTWTIETPVEGVSIDAATGELSFEDSANLDGLNLTVKATLQSDDEFIDPASDTIVFTLRDDGYKTSEGIVVSTPQELYDVFFSADRAKVDRNITRTIKLGADIVMPDPAGQEGNTMWSGSATANWRGVEEFYGVFDGQGHTISNLQVEIYYSSDVFMPDHPYAGAPRYDGNAGWGFFRHLGDQNTGRKGEVRNLVMRDSLINYREMYTVLNGENRYIGGIAQYFECGLIKDCLVDIDIRTITNYAGMVAGSVGGTQDLEGARYVGSARIENTLAMGSIESTLPAGDTSVRREWEPYACGAFIGKTENSGSEFVNCFAMGAPGKDINFSNRTDASMMEYCNRFENSGFKSMDEFQLASTFADAGFDPDVWFYEDGYYPTLRYEGFVKPDPVPSIVTITNKDASFFDRLAVTEGVQVETQVVNPRGNEVIYAIEPAVAGVSVDADGLVTFAEDVADGASVTVTVSLGEGSQGDSWTFSIYNDGYDPATGMPIASARELYDTFFGETASRSLTRNFYLSADIALGEYANWQGIPKGFTGHFDGKGHTISGLDVDVVESSGSQGYGFFLGLSENAVVENLKLEGNVKYQVFMADAINNGVSNGVAALAQSMSGGIIRNVLIDVDVQTNAEFNAPVVAHMTGGQILNSISLGSMSGIDGAPVVAPGDRPGWAPFTFGAFAGKIDSASCAVTGCYALGASSANLGFTNRADGSGEIGGVQNSGFKTEEELKTGTDIYADYDTNIWNIVSGEIPSLKVQA